MIGQSKAATPVHSRLLYSSFSNTVILEAGRISHWRIGFPTRNVYDCMHQNHLEAFKRFGTVNRFSEPLHLVELKWLSGFAAYNYRFNL
jgi:hypothetical protein